MTYWEQLGVIAYPLAIVAAFLFVQISRGVRNVARKDGPHRSGIQIHSILLWGFLGAAVGTLGTLVGLTQMASFLEQADRVSPGLIWGGLKVALSSSVVGLLLLGLAAIAWLALQYIIGRRLADTA